MIKFSIQQKRVWTYDSKFTFFFVRIQLELIVNNQRYTVQQNSSAFFDIKLMIEIIFDLSVFQFRDWGHSLPTRSQPLKRMFFDWWPLHPEKHVDVRTLRKWTRWREIFRIIYIYIYIYTYIFFLLCICIFSTSARFRFRRHRLLPLSFFLHLCHQLNLSHELNSWWGKFRRSYRLILKSKVWIHICFDVTKSYSILSNSFLILKEKHIFTVSWISWFHATQIRIECKQ